MKHDQHTSCRFRGKEERMLQWAPCFFALAASRAAGLGDKRNVAANWSAGRLFLLQLYALCPLPFSRPFSVLNACEVATGCVITEFQSQMFKRPFSSPF
jgi:hypothetical protein